MITAYVHVLWYTYHAFRILPSFAAAARCICLTNTPRMSYLLSLGALFVCLRIFLGFVVHQKLSIFQGLLKALETVLLQCGSKKSHEIFQVKKNVKHI